MAGELDTFLLALESDGTGPDYSEGESPSRIAACRLTFSLAGHVEALPLRDDFSLPTEGKEFYRRFPDDPTFGSGFYRDFVEQVNELFKLTISHKPNGLRQISDLAQIAEVVVGCVGRKPNLDESRDQEDLGQLLRTAAQRYFCSTIWSNDFFLFPVDPQVGAEMARGNRPGIWTALISKRIVQPSEILLHYIGRQLYTRCRMPNDEQRLIIVERLDQQTLDSTMETLLHMLKAAVIDPTDRQALETAIQVCEKLKELERQRQPRGSRPQSTFAELSGPTIERNEALKDEPAIVIPSIAEFQAWESAAVFTWFKRSILTVPRKTLIPLIKGWLKKQAGKHDFSNISDGEKALLAKRDLAASVMEVLDALGLKLCCGKDGCGVTAKLHAIKGGNSRSGQYYFSHQRILDTNTKKAQATKAKTEQHGNSTAFPSLKFKK